jgi:CRISPR-associated protein Cas1
VLSRTVVVGQPAFLSVEDAQLVVALRQDARRPAAPGLREPAKGSAHGRVPLDDLGVLVLDGPGIALTKDLLAACSARNVAVVVCDDKRLPAAQLVPYEAHTLTGKVFREQLAASVPLKKQVWKQIVQAKLREQAAALLAVARQTGDKASAPSARRRLEAAARKVSLLAARVGSGDPDNREAQAAAVYFGALFGKEFVRDRDEPGTNALLNYGYAVMRACVARALVGTGLHPALSVHHDSQYNAFGLVDDAVEPLRPMVDLHVLSAVAAGHVPHGLDPTLKRYILQFLDHDVGFGGKSVPLATGLALYAASLKRVVCGQARKVVFPSRLDGQGDPA